MTSIADEAAGFVRSLDARWDGRVIHDPTQGALVSFLSIGSTQPLVELVQPDGEESPVARFAQRGGGLHHLCYEVLDLEQQIRDSRVSESLIVRQPEPAVAFENRRICWVFTPQRLLIEYLEATRK